MPLHTKKSLLVAYAYNIHLMTEPHAGPNQDGEVAGLRTTKHKAASTGNNFQEFGRYTKHQEKKGPNLFLERRDLQAELDLAVKNQGLLGKRLLEKGMTTKKKKELLKLEAAAKKKQAVLSGKMEKLKKKIEAMKELDAVDAAKRRQQQELQNLEAKLRVAKNRKNESLCKELEAKIKVLKGSMQRQSGKLSRDVKDSKNEQPPKNNMDNGTKNNMDNGKNTQDPQKNVKPKAQENVKSKIEQGTGLSITQSAAESDDEAVGSQNDKGEGGAPTTVEELIQSAEVVLKAGANGIPEDQKDGQEEIKNEGSGKESCLEKCVRVATRYHEAISTTLKDSHAAFLHHVT